MRVLWIALVIVAVDQVTKLVVLQNMYVGQSIPLIGDWLKFTFTENPGMAFGITFGPKGFVSILSITATLLILLYLYRVRHSYSWYRVSIGFILGGAFGNIIDRVFYGAIFYNNSLFTGHVVDFIHLNLWRGYIPESWPMIGGKYAALFPIWNVADMAIVVGVIGILVFQNKFQESIMQHVQEQGDVDEPTLTDAVESSAAFANSEDPAIGKQENPVKNVIAPQNNAPPASVSQEPTVGE